MTKIYITANTCFKAKPIAAAELGKGDRIDIRSGEIYEAAAMVRDGSHTRLTLGKDENGVQIALQGRNTWWLYNGHFTSKEAIVYSPKQGTIAPKDIRLNSIACALIKDFEGLELKAYVCPADKITIGWGSTEWFNGEQIPLGVRINEAQATELFERDCQRFIRALRLMVKSSLTPRQIAALTSFAYNCGSQALADSTLLREINSGAGSEAIVAQFMRWTNQGLPGLVRRREAEVKLWLGFDWQ